MTESILIVDDDHDIRQSMVEYIETHRFFVSSVGSGEDALAFLKNKRIDVVIADIKMQGMDGLELTERIKKEYDTDVIVMTGYSNDHSYEDAINKGASDFVFKPLRYEELLLRLKRVLRERHLNRERIEMLEKLNRLAITDGLTKLYNSRHFYNQLNQEINRIKRYGHALSLMLFDIDHFKEYNDKHGHLEGDSVLINIGRVIKSCLRKMDTAYRYGGEEFTVILPETNCDEATHVAERIRLAVEKEIFTSPETNNATTITISVGVTQYQPDEKITSFIQRVDKAMYISKKNGRNQVSILNA